MNQAAKIALTMGDPAGVGPELCLRACHSGSFPDGTIPLIFGSFSVLKRVSDQLQLALPEGFMTWSDLTDQSAPCEPAIVDFDPCQLESVEPGVINAKTGAASFRFVDAAIQAAMNGIIDGVVTAPIHKEAWHAAGIRFPGHTELLGATTQAARSCMMLTSAEITCSFVTAHVGLAEVSRLVTRQRVLDVIELTAEAMSRIRNRPAQLLVCGLNPHAGEHGLFGDQEEEISIAPAVKEARHKGIDVSGPVPADTAFLPANRRHYDAFICMYHDQGLAPLKALAFETAVNTTLGLPIIRTSVDHGTALDLAWQGKADSTSMREAIRLAADLIGTRSPSS